MSHTASAALPADVMLFGESPALQRSLQNFDMAAKVLNLDRDVAVRLRRPTTVLIVSIPTKMDDGRIEVYTGMRVQHSHALGPCKGGIRYHPDVDVGETTALAMQMTWKTALMQLPLGGAKGAVRVDPYKLSPHELQSLTRRFTAEIMPIIGPEVDVPAPDMGTDGNTMAWIMDTYSQRTGKFTPAVVTGKPVEVGGSVLRKEATGRGVFYTVQMAAEEIDLPLKGATVSLHGFGNVGTYAAQSFHEVGSKITAIADVSGGYINDKGFDVPALLRYVEQHRTLEGCGAGDKVPADAVLTHPCDILLPAATGHVITAENAPRVRCKIMGEGANGPTMPEADPILERNGVFIVPDSVCNAGGVIVSYFEQVQGGMMYFWTAGDIDAKLRHQLTLGYHAARKFSKEHKVPFRIGALCCAIARVDHSMRLRGLYA